MSVEAKRYKELIGVAKPPHIFVVIGKIQINKPLRKC
jgi:hypothetical protein